MVAVHIVLAAPKVEAIKPLIKESDIVIGVDRGALLALEEGIQVDVALGDFDSISAEEKDFVETKVKKKLNYPSVKDDTDAELAFLYVLEHYPAAEIYLYNWYGGRIDHLYSILLMPIQERFASLIPRLHLVSGKNSISYFLPGEHQVDKLSDMDYLSYILLTEVVDLTLNGVKYALKEESYDRPIALISNEFLSNKATFSFETGIVAAIQSKD